MKSGPRAPERLSFDIPFARRIQMRFSLPVTALLSLLLVACSTPAPNKHIPQSGPLKVHPGLLGKPVPSELQEPVAIKPVEGSGQVLVPQLPNQIPSLPAHFVVDSTDLLPADGDVVRSHARYLTTNPNTKVRLEGHADERGTPEYNVRLGQKRAEAVRAALVSQGVNEKQTSIRSLGKSQPKVAGHDESAWSQNRRVEFIYETPKQK